MSPSNAVRTAVIDVGTLKSKFEIREFDVNFNSTVIYKDKQLTVLGRDLDKTDGVIVEKSIVKTIEALKDFKIKLDEHQVKSYISVTTEAIRKARNAKEVLERIKDETGISLITLSHDEEAEVYFHSVSKDFKDKIIAVSDIGGGSVQVVVGRNEEILAKFLFKTGTYYLQEGFSQSHHPTIDEVNNAFDYIREQLKSLKDNKFTPEILVYGSTNIIDFFKAMNLPLKEKGNGDHIYEIIVKELEPLYEKLIGLSYEDRMPLYPEEPYYMWAADKALMNIFTICEYLGIDRIYPSNNNISTGLLIDQVRKLNGTRS
jgi:exopolyphosphatase/guanosine-5'-triphosphate,3'-diphosphate pyrophosphatase